MIAALYSSWGPGAPSHLLWMEQFLAGKPFKRCSHRRWRKRKWEWVEKCLVWNMLTSIETIGHALMSGLQRLCRYVSLILILDSLIKQKKKKTAYTVAFYFIAFPATIYDCCHYGHWRTIRNRGSQIFRGLQSCFWKRIAKSL